MKKVLNLALTASALLLFAGCQKGSQFEGKTYRIGICNYVDDASLNQIVTNIESTLEAANNEEVRFERLYQNCQADSVVLNQIISNFIVQEVDLMVAVATPVAMAMQAATEDSQIPVVFAAVSDPVSAGLVESLERPGANLTGTSDYLDTEAIFNLVFALDETVDKVGLLYDVGQDASTAAIATAKTILSEKGVSIIESTGTNVSEIQQAAKNLVSQGVDEIFTPSDNTVMEAELSIYEDIANAKIPHYAGADAFALNGAFCGYGVDYANLGIETGEMVIDILENEKKPETYPVKTFDNGIATINTETCAKLGYEIEQVKDVFSPYCTAIKTLTTGESF